MTANRKPMKPVKAWAVMDEGELALNDYRLPVTWLRSGALSYRREKLNGVGRVVRVEIREVTR